MIWRSPEGELLPTLEELSIGFVTFAPLGKGFLTGKIDKNTIFESSDFRITIPRFQSDNLKANYVLVELIEKVGAADVELTSEELSDLNEALSKIKILGDRYPVGSDFTKRVG